MRDGGRIAAAMELLHIVLSAHVPPGRAVSAWGIRARYAGARDRAFITGLIMDALRHRSSLTHRLGLTPEDQSEYAARLLILATLAQIWERSPEQLEQNMQDQYAPASLSAAEIELLYRPVVGSVELPVAGNFPRWLHRHVERVFGARAQQEMQAMTLRAPVDMRLNSLKTDMNRAMRQLQPLGATAIAEMTEAIRIPAPAPDRGRPAPGSIPAFARGWFEIQDLGSQCAAALVGAAPGEQILDYCAGAGGKTLAMAAAMNNRGQIYAHDSEARRMTELVTRMRRAGVRNTKLCQSRDLPELISAMDAVLLDVPCSGSGTWRRRPEAKWRFSAGALTRHCARQQDILEQACCHVRPGGRLIYVTCSFLAEENQDNIAAFLDRHPEFVRADILAIARACGKFTAAGLERLSVCLRPEGDLLLTPLSFGSDIFFTAIMTRKTG